MALKFNDTSVLVVGTSPAMLNITMSVLEIFGIRHIHTAHNSQDGFDGFCALSPNIVIIDQPDDPHSALALAKKIRNNGADAATQTPILLTTNYSQKSHIAAAESLVTDFLVKPFTARVLYKKIEDTIRLIQSPDNGISRPAPHRKDENIRARPLKYS